MENDAMKKMFALCLAFVMLLTVLAGCKKTEPGADLNEPQTAVTTPDNTAQQDANPTTDDDDSWKEEHPTWLCKDKTTLTVYTWEGVSSNYLPPSNELFFWQYMEDYTNVHIEPACPELVVNDVLHDMRFFVLPEMQAGVAQA